MAQLLDASLWIDFTRPRSSRTLKLFLAPFVLDPATHLAEPIVFEVLRHATPAESKGIVRQFQTLPLLATPATLWSDAADLGQHCRQKGITVNSIDLLVAALAIHHDAEVITFDDDFQKIATVTNLRAKLLKRPS